VPFPFGHAVPQGEDDPDGPSVDQINVWAWRFVQAEKLGYRPAECEQIAAADLDLHRLRKLIDGGCDRQVALRIML
jgi:hypothetical protein